MLEKNNLKIKIIDIYYIVMQYSIFGFILQF